MTSLSARAVSDFPEVPAGADLAELILTALSAQAPPVELNRQQIVVIAHKVVSKAEGAVVNLTHVQPSPRARELAAGETPTGSGPSKDPRAVEVVLSQTQEVVRAAHGVLICRTHQGFVCANAGVDASNSASPDTLILLPRDPDGSARRLRARLRELSGVAPGVIITDSFGRAWRHGQCDVAIGCAGVIPLEDWRGRTDSSGRELQATWLASSDAIAATADLARSKDSREPVVIIEGLERFICVEDGPGAAELLRPVAEDLFR